MHPQMDLCFFPLTSFVMHACRLPMHAYHLPHLACSPFLSGDVLCSSIEVFDRQPCPATCHPADVDQIRCGKNFFAVVEIDRALEVLVID